MNEIDPTGPEQAPGRWQPGQSGNPSGRPRGSRDRALAALDAIGDEAAIAILRTVVAAAIGGETRAAELLLSRLWPVRRGRPIALELPAVTKAADLPAAIGAVVAAMAEGRISAEEALAVGAVLETQRRVAETAELAGRIAALEQAREGRR